MDLEEKVRKIEALIDRAGSQGERAAAKEAKRRLSERQVEPPVEYRVRLDGSWGVKLFYELCLKYRVRPVRKKGQRQTTVVVNVTSAFMKETLWPEYQQLQAELDHQIHVAMAPIVARLHAGSV